MSVVVLIPRSIQQMSVAKLRSRLRALTGAATALTNREHLQQEVARAISLKLAATRAKEAAPGMHHARTDKRLPPAGSVIERKHDGETYRVTVLEDAFEYDGKRYTSLSTIAKEITGTNWNGFAFFGVLAPIRRPGLAKARVTIAETRRATSHR